jgi:PAS domain S-box-containing protein
MSERGETPSLLRIIVDKLPGMVAYWDADLRCRFANRAYIKWFGVEPQDMLGKHITELLGPLYVLNRPYIEGALRGEEQEFEREIPDPKGGPPRQSQAHYIPDEVDGVVRGFCVLVVDITRRKQAEDGLLRMERQLQSTERLAAMATLAAGMAHEINNPLAITLTNLELALDDEDTPPAARATLEVAREAARRIGAIVEGMKLLAQGDPRRRELVDVNKTLDQSVALAGNLIRYRAQLIREHEDTGYVLGDASQLAQVLVNLLVNAAQALPEDQTEGSEIRLSSWRTAEAVVIEVHDNGCGVPEELHDKIFEPFFTTKDVGVGMGLGLSISSGIVASMGGKIAVRSRPGGGSVFTVTLPPASAPQILPSPPQEAQTPLVVPGRLRVLVVDDEILLARALARVLNTHEVTVLEDAEQAIAALTDGEHTYDLVLCDLMMPHISGAELYTRVTQRRPELAPLFVFMTGGAFTPRGREFLQSVSAPILEKPFDVQRVRELVAAHAARYQTGR